MNKPIIIDGADISECKNFSRGICIEENKIPRSIEHFTADCRLYPNCYYKQLKRLEQENKKLVNIINERTDLKNKYKQALEEVRDIAKLIKDDDDKPTCIYDEGCPLNGGAGFDNHCNMTCPYVLAKIIDDKINEVLEDEE